ncbi:MAG: PSD1 and planctomycete cytochrome C domain-containing protein, partial [Planctomycetota bacterium]
LDERSGATAKLKSGRAAVVPGQIEASELWQRVATTDADAKMPPEDSGKSLSGAELKLIKRWIQSGAEWSGHWAFDTPVKPRVPNPVPGWKASNPIDRFIQRRVKQSGLEPAEAADKETSIRRVAFDLTGLPPTLAEVERYLADDAPESYGRMVDRFLASKRYGEHMARIWLDAARYADTHGLHLDNERSVWPYRDWVIESFNRNQPFDDFTVEQIAGDLLPNPSLDQKVATGFNRCNVTTGEGGSIDAEYYVRYAVERVDTTSTVWLGLTAGCAACHDHKFDPLTQKEFYQLFSFFYSLTERAMDGNQLLPPPSLKVPTLLQRQDRARYERELVQARKDVDRIVASFEYTDPSPNAKLGTLERKDKIWFDDALPKGAKPQGTTPWEFVTKDKHPVRSGKNSVRRKSGKQINQHFFTGANPPLKLGENAVFFAWVYLDPKDPPETLQLQFNDGTWEHRAFWGADKAFNPGRNNASNLRHGDLPPTGKWVRLEVPAKNVGLKAGSAINGWAFTQFGGTVYWDGAGVVGVPSLSDEQLVSINLWEQYQRSAKPGLPGDIQKIVNVPAETRDSGQRAKLETYYLRNVHPEVRRLLGEPLGRQTRLSQAIVKLDKSVSATLVMQDRKSPRQAYVLERGEYTLQREKVSSRIPTWIAPPVEGAPANRLGLARWLVRKDHPLTSRVTVNRFWQQFFGIGIVRTSEDFGIQGERPTHPELLDWLAVEFIDSGWNVKQLMRLLVTSSTYRQSSKVTPEKLAADPENRLLARGPRFRLDAEAIRDQALFVSGLLVDRTGGRSVKPYQPAGLWKPVGFGGSNTSVFRQDKGEKLYRRSMYTFWKRTSPPPSMSAFDAPDRETCQVRRARTNTPLQALVLMNDVQFVEAARRFAARVLREAGTPEERVDYAFRAVLARRPTDSERKGLLQSFESFQRTFSAAPKLAKELLSAGESAHDETLDASELAAWTMIAHLILNLSEAVTRG